MLEVLESSSEYFQEGWELMLKPHPATPIDISNYPRLQLTLSVKPLADLLPSFHFVIASFSTGILEAHALGLPVITMLDAHNFNFSPFKVIKN